MNTTTGKPVALKIRCALCNRWLPGNDRLRTPVGLSHAACVMAFQAAKLTLTAPVAK